MFLAAPAALLWSKKGLTRRDSKVANMAEAAMVVNVALAADTAALASSGAIIVDILLGP